MKMYSVPMYTGHVRTSSNEHWYNKHAGKQSNSSGPFTLGDVNKVDFNLSSQINCMVTKGDSSHLVMTSNQIHNDVIMNGCCTYLDDNDIKIRTLSSAKQKIHHGCCKSNQSSSPSVNGPLRTNRLQGNQQANVVLSNFKLIL